MKTPSIKIYYNIGFKSSEIGLNLSQVSSDRVKNIVDGRGITYVNEDEIDSKLAVDCTMVCATEKLAEILSNVDVMVKVSLRKLNGHWCLVVESIKNLKSIISKYVIYDKMESQDLSWDELHKMI